MDIQRYKLTIAYRGTHYHGWQTQAANAYYGGETLGPGRGIPTIQEIVSRALRDVVRHEVRLCGSSRTDAGVHAKGQVAHFDTGMARIPPEGLRRAVNSRLPEDILIRSIQPVGKEFDAINCTMGKRYQYAIWNSADRSVFHGELAWHRWQKLDRDAMAAAAGHFIGRHDFATFARPGHGRQSTIRTVQDCRVSWDRGLTTERGEERQGARGDAESQARNPLIVVGVEGEGFLWHMVRIMVGTLVEVGLGHHGPDDILKMIEARDRRAAGRTAPPHGLYLQWIRHREAVAP